jgi:hypothetical protein
LETKISKTSDAIQQFLKKRNASLCFYLLPELTDLIWKYTGEVFLPIELAFLCQADVEVENKEIIVHDPKKDDQVYPLRQFPFFCLEKDCCSSTSELTYFFRNCNIRQQKVQIDPFDVPAPISPIDWDGVLRQKVPCFPDWIRSVADVKKHFSYFQTYFMAGVPPSSPFLSLSVNENDPFFFVCGREACISSEDGSVRLYDPRRLVTKKIASSFESLLYRHLLELYQVKKELYDYSKWKLFVKERCENNCGFRFDLDSSLQCFVRTSESS